MLKPCLFLSALVACGLPSALADTIQLKDKAAITGKILAEKSDQVVVDQRDHEVARGRIAAVPGEVGRDAGVEAKIFNRAEESADSDDKPNIYLCFRKYSMSRLVEASCFSFESLSSSGRMAEASTLPSCTPH